MNADVEHATQGDVKGVRARGCAQEQADLSANLGGDVGTDQGGSAKGRSQDVGVRRSMALLAGLMLGAVLFVTVSVTAAFAASEGSDALLQMLVRGDEQGVVSFSTDDGATWTEGVPEGATVTTTVDENGETFTTVTVGMPEDSPAGAFVGMPPSGSEGVDAHARLAVRITDDGLTEYSIDGGKVWSIEVPEGVTISPDGMVTMGSGDR